jgi:hypothetical protein
MENDRIARLPVEGLTREQKAMIELFGQPVMGWSTVAVYDEGTGQDGVPGGGHHIRDHRCPVIVWRGRERSILPDGGVHVGN